MNRCVTQVISLVTALLLTPLAVSAATPLKTPALFGDHMVLQRDQQVPVWGWSTPGEDVVVEFAGQKKTGRTDTEGKWMVKLDPLAASMEPQMMRIARTEESLVFANILVGDVWLCSGQSNMFFRMSKVENSQQEIAAANQPNVRFFAVKEQFARSPAAHVGGAWKPVSPVTAAKCSAVAFYFATALQQKLGVPIGLLVGVLHGF
jgi:sialate O-acetylesterase